MAFLTFLGCVALLTMLVIAGWAAFAAPLDDLLVRWRRMTPFGRIVALLAVGVSVLYGGGKTNDAALAISRSAHRGASATDSQMVARARNWNIRGAWDDSFDLTFADGFLFPFGTNRLTSIEVFSQGYLRPSLPLASSPDPSFLPPCPSYLLPCTSSPSSHLSLIPNHSSFSYEHTPSNTYRFSWENVPFGRIPLGNLDAATNNFFIELFRNGDSVISSNGISRLIPYVCPGDWDGDGIPNEKDAEPTVPNGENFDSSDERPDNANSTAYRTIDLVSLDVTAEIRFVGDGVSNLPDPHFIARQGITNRVTFLVGKTYRIESAFPISCAGVSDSATVVTTNSACSLTIVRPVTFSRTDTAARSAGGFRMNVDPPDLNGVFHWTSNACCTVTGIGSLFSTHCDACTCGGCMLGGVYVYEGYALGFGGIPCGCSEDFNSNEEENEPSLNVSFSEDALFYEEAYTNTPNDVVARRHSTNVTVRVSASGGPHGGVFNLTRTGFDKLSFVEGDPLPEEIIRLAPNETRSWRAEYAPCVHSATKDDVTLSARFDEHLTGDTLSDEDKMTVVMVTSVTDAAHPENRYRHLLGVGESVSVYSTPNIPFDLVWSIHGGVVVEQYAVVYRAPKEGCCDIVVFDCGISSYKLNFAVVQPNGYQIQSIETNSYADVGCSGGFEMHFYGRILPGTVSFEHLEVIEIPSAATDATGYYSQTSKTNLWNHGAHGAGKWIQVTENNGFSDETIMEINDPPWLGGGSFTWPIPNAWRVKDSYAETNFFCMTNQRFVLDSLGTARMSKFGYVGIRLTNGVFTVMKE